MPATGHNTPHMLGQTLAKQKEEEQRPRKHAKHVMTLCMVMTINGYGIVYCRCIAISPEDIAAATGAAMNTLIKLGRRRQGLLACTRAFATEAGALEASAPKQSQPSGDSPFLRFATPVPQVTNHQQIFSTIPQTQVLCLSVLCRCCTIRWCL